MWDFNVDIKLNKKCFGFPARRTCHILDEFESKTSHKLIVKGKSFWRRADSLESLLLERLIENCIECECYELRREKRRKRTKRKRTKLKMNQMNQMKVKSN